MQSSLDHLCMYACEATVAGRRWELCTAEEWVQWVLLTERERDRQSPSYQKKKKKRQKEAELKECVTFTITCASVWRRKKRSRCHESSVCWGKIPPLPSDWVREGYRLLGRLSNVLALLSLPPWVAWYSVLPLTHKHTRVWQCRNATSWLICRFLR